MFDLKRSSSPLSIAASADFEELSKNDDKLMADVPQVGKEANAENVGWWSSSDHWMISAHERPRQKSHVHCTRRYVYGYGTLHRRIDHRRETQGEVTQTRVSCRMYQ